MDWIVLQVNTLENTGRVEQCGVLGLALLKTLVLYAGWLVLSAAVLVVAAMLNYICRLLKVPESVLNAIVVLLLIGELACLVFYLFCVLYCTADLKAVLLAFMFSIVTVVLLMARRSR